MGQSRSNSPPQHNMHSSSLPVVAVVLVMVSSSPAPETNMASKEILTNSLIALKTKPADEPPVYVDDAGVEGKAARQKRSGVVPFTQQLGSLNIGQQNTEQVTAAAAVLAKYIRDTGDQEGVVEFLQFMVKSGKLSPKEVIVYVNKVMENLRSEEEQHNDGGDEVQKQRHTVQADNERKQLEDLHNNKITQLELEKKSLTQTKEENEKKIIALQNQKSKEEEEFKKKQKLSQLAKEVE